MIPSFNLGSDSLGLGEALGSAFNADGTADCGSKPTCLGWSNSCKEKQKAYNECRMKALEIDALQANADAYSSANRAKSQSMASSQKTKIALIAGVVLVVVILLIKR